MEYNLIVNQEKKSIDAVISDQNIKVQTKSKAYNASFMTISDYHILLNVDGQNFNAYVWNDGGTKTVIIKGRSYEVLDADLVEQNSSGEKSFASNARVVASPMPAVVICVLAQVGDRVKKGQGLVIVSAMKMETTLFAPFDGTISGINAKEGDKVMPADILVDIEKD
ncbi:MAG: hypothetical protein GXP56_15820 [Deltaproteobacteria bacterium]|nr:hypothetical protein [Deltaproteobacteria bacterium]